VVVVVDVVVLSPLPCDGGYMAGIYYRAPFRRHSRSSPPTLTPNVPIISSHTQDIPLFAKMIPNVRVKFSLITLGTRDMPSAFSRSVVRTISTSPWLVAWYMQNLDDTARGNGKMHVFPLGIDYHTLAGSLAQQRGVGAEGTFGLAETSSPQEQDNRVKAIYTAARPWADRPRMLYVGKYGDTHATRKTTEFKSIPERVRGALRVQERQPRWSMLEGVAECKFVLAPRGLGMSSIRFVAIHRHLSLSHTRSLPPASPFPGEFGRGEGISTLRF
jgi:hypothetical protein